MQTLVEIGPSNASSGKPKRKNVTEQIYIRVCVCIYVMYMYVFLYMHSNVLSTHTHVCIFIYMYRNVHLTNTYTHIYVKSYRFISMFLKKAVCCRNIEIVLHPMALSYT